MVNLPAAEKAVRDLLLALGQDVTREGLVKTPARVARAYAEMLAGYQQDPAEILRTSFAESENYNDMIVLRDVPFTSLCEHHMIPFIGSATVAYWPRFGGSVVGLSKLARLVECFARRLQLQERMTKQIADALQRHLQPSGFGVVVRAQHQCMCARGVKKSGAMVTRTIGGVFETTEVYNAFARLAGV